ncbi:MAG: 23S rRNA (pseudouridine(1915)-N(3))-methyltransferase RlmH [Crocinitomicaceae bacterium]
MKLKLIYTGKTGKSFLIDGEKEYLNRLKHYVKLEVIELPDIKNAHKLSEEEIKSKEADQLLKKIDSQDQIILLDDKGKQFTSMDFADFFQQKMNTGTRSICFIIGGPYGFDEKIYNLPHSKLSLSKMTFSHQMIRMIFLEQVYRSYTILKGEPYHHE